MLAEKSELEIKRLRSSQVINKVSFPEYGDYVSLVICTCIEAMSDKMRDSKLQCNLDQLQQSKSHRSHLHICPLSFET